MKNDFKMFLWYITHPLDVILKGYRIYKCDVGYYEVCTPEYWQAKQKKLNEPKKIIGFISKELKNTTKTHQDLENEWGVKFYNGDDSDIVFEFEMPDGWSMKHHNGAPGYWTDIVNDNGFIIANVFFKGSEYDRHSHTFILETPKKYEF